MKQDSKNTNSICITCGKSFKPKYHFATSCKECYDKIKAEKLALHKSEPAKYDLFIQKPSRSQLNKIRTLLKQTNRLIPELLKESKDIIDFKLWLEKSDIHLTVVNAVWGNTESFFEKLFIELGILNFPYVNPINTFTVVRAIICEHYFRTELLSNTYVIIKD